MSSPASALDVISHHIGMSVPEDYDKQLQFLANTENDIKKLIHDDFETNAEAEYDKVFQALVQRRLTPTDETCNTMELYRLLYERIRTEDTDLAPLVVSWLQPPLFVVQSCQYDLDSAIQQYKQMLAKVTSSHLTEEALQCLSAQRTMKWIKKQAFVVGLACSCQEMCEIVWRFFTKQYSGKA
jgi:hypothetical protein